jgi:ATP-binding cassette subfamily B protein
MPRSVRNSASRDGQDVLPARITTDSLRDAVRLLAYLLPYQTRFAAALLALFCSSLLGLAFPYLAGRLIDAALRNGGPVRAGPLPGDLTGITLVVLLALGLQALFGFFHALTFADVGQRCVADLRRDTYARLIRLGMAFYAQRRVGELGSRLSADLAQIEGTLIGAVPQFLRQLAVLIGGMVLLTFTSGQLTLLMLGTIPPLIGVAALFGRRMRRVAKEAQDKLADTQVIVEETLQGILNVKAFTNEGYEQDRYQNGLRLYLESVFRGARYRALFNSFIPFALFAAMVLVLWYGARLVQSGGLSAGELTRFMLYTMFVGGALGSFAELYSQIQRALGASQRVRELLQEQPEELGIPSLAPVTTFDSIPNARLGGDVVFDRVTFSYPSRKDVQVLRNLSLAARAGQRIALVGPSGAGKSTVVALLLRLYEPDAGHILIDGKDAREYGLHELRRGMAIVPQDVLLFGGSIAENIAYGKPGASVAEIQEAARQANAHDFVEGFPEGYQTRVGERGIQLSGGQRQRVAIARAILKNPAILILDEATSSLDSESESLVQQALDRLMQGRTSLIIAHRLSTVRRADCIFVVKDGAVVESGTHAELLERENGLYRTHSELQLDLH